MKTNASKYVPNFINNSYCLQEQQFYGNSSKKSVPLGQIKNSKKHSIIRDGKNHQKKAFVQREQKSKMISQQRNATIVYDISQTEQIQTARSYIKPVNRTVRRINLDQLNDKQNKPFQSRTEIDQNNSEKTINLVSFNRISKLAIDDLTDNSDLDEIPQIKASQKKITMKLSSKKQVETFDVGSTNIDLFAKIQNQKRVQCIIRRDKSNSDGILQFNIYIQKSMRHLLTVKKQGLWKHNFYLREEKDKGAFKYTPIAVLESTVLGNKYSLFIKNQVFSDITICYETNILGLMGPRKMNIYLPTKTLPYEYLDQGFESEKDKDNIIKCKNKKAIWDERAKGYGLDFQGRAGQSSIKNFVITDEKEDQSKFLLIFAKASKEVYNLDIQSPFSLIQGIAVAMSSFQRKLTCD